MSSPHSVYSSGRSRSPASCERTPSRSPLPSTDENLSPRSSPSSSCSLFTLLQCFSGPTLSTSGSASVFAGSGSVKTKSRKGHSARELSSAARRNATEVIDVFSESDDDPVNPEDVKILGEVIDVTSDDECTILRHIVKRKISEPVSGAEEESEAATYSRSVKRRIRGPMPETEDESEATNYPKSDSSAGEFSFDSEPLSPLSFGSPGGSPFAGLFPGSLDSVAGSIGSDLPFSDESYDGSVYDFGDPEELLVEITPKVPESGDQRDVPQDEPGMSADLTCEDGELAQEIPDGANDDAGPGEGEVVLGEYLVGDQGLLVPVGEYSLAMEQDDGASATGPDMGREGRFFEDMQVVPEIPQGSGSNLDEFECHIDRQCVLEEGSSGDNAVSLYSVEDTATLSLDD